MIQQRVEENTVQRGTRRLIMGVVIISFTLMILGLGFAFVSMLTPSAL
jgi:hypothetical protein